eukprot:6081833-Prymnesium_polylepis.1
MFSAQQQSALGASKPTFYVDLSAPGIPIPNPSPSWTEITDANMLSQLALLGTMTTNASGA